MTTKDILQEDLNKAETAVLVAQGVMMKAGSAAEMFVAVELLRGALNNAVDVAETWRHMEAEAERDEEDEIMDQETWAEWLHEMLYERQ